MAPSIFVDYLCLFNSIFPLGVQIGTGKNEYSLNVCIHACLKLRLIQIKLCGQLDDRACENDPSKF